MIKTNEQFAAANQAAIDSMLTVANISLANAERLAALNLNTARSFFADAVATLQTLSSVKDVQGLMALQSSLAQPTIEKAVAYSRSVYEILSESSGSMNQIIESQSAEIKKNFSAALEQSMKNAPAGSESVMAAVKSVMAQADSAFETMTQSSKQAKAMIENAVASSNAATIKLIAKAA